MPRKPPKRIQLSDWDEFDDSLRTEIAALGHRGHVSVRNFDLVTSRKMGVEQDRLQLVMDTGTDRDRTSQFWNEFGHDYDHDKNPSGKKANEIIYAYAVDPVPKPYRVHHEDESEAWDLTEGLTEYHGIIIYDRDRMTRKAPNEYWFIGDPLDAVLLVYTIDPA